MQANCFPRRSASQSPHFPPIFLAVISPRLALASLCLFIASIVTAASAQPVHVALILDDGPDAAQTPKLLSVFARQKVHVTFGTMGKNAEANPRLLKRVVAAGHEVVNHSSSHQQPKDLTAEQIDAQVADGQRTITAAAGKAPVWYWPPYIAIDDRVRASVAKAGLRIYTPRKLVASGDYMNDVDAAEILRRATTGIEDGTVILFHEWRPETATQMKAVIKELKRQGCVFLTFSQMAAYLGQ